MIYQDKPGPNILEAYELSSKHRDCTDQHKSNDEDFMRYFLLWIENNNKLFWKDLNYSDIEAYIAYLRDRGLKKSTIIHYLAPVRRTAAWMAACFPMDYVDICKPVNFRGIKEEKKTIKAYSFPEVLNFIQFIALYKKQHLIIPVALQGLCGLRLTEAIPRTLHIGLTTLDIKEGKNQHSIRRIPLPAFVLALIKEYGGLINAHYTSHRTYSKAISAMLKHYDGDNYIPPKDLRNTLLTTAVYGKWHRYSVDRYVGHAPANIGEAHYVGTEDKDLVGLLRTEVANKIDETIEKSLENSEE